MHFSSANNIEFKTAGVSRFLINNFGAHIQATKPLIFLASSGDSSSIKSGGTNANDLLFSVGGSERLRITSSGLSKVGSGITFSPDGNIFTTGVTTATTFVGALTGTASNATLAVSAQGLTGSPNITVTNINAVDTIISGNLSVAGTITSLDQNDISVTGIMTASAGVDLGDPGIVTLSSDCLLYTSPRPRDKRQSRMPSSA